MEDTNKNKRLKEVKFLSASYFSLVLLFIVFFITLSSIFKIWEQENFLQILSLSLIIITLPFILFSTALILFRSVDTPKGKKPIEYILFYFNKEKIENTKVLTKKEHLILKVAFFVVYFILLSSFISLTTLVFVSAINRINSEQIKFVQFILFDCLFITSHSSILLKKIYQVYIGRSNERKKTDFLYFYNY